MRSLTRYLFLLGAASLVRADGNAAGTGAGYDTSRLGPSNANCDRQVYQLSVTSNNVAFKDQIKPNMNEVSLTL